MPAKKIRMEVFDEEGNRYTIAFEGKVTRKKALCLLDIVELLGGAHDKQELNRSVSKASKYDKIKSIVEKHFPFTWFSSKEVLATYEQEFNEPISLSTASTYLARMADRSFLLRRGPANNRKYRMMTELAQSTIKIGEDK
ncbi:MAG: hypothetical protein OEY24_01490 [Candidatus Bathyarchaeota archaeon]|nr:hypothetical protein [Candidatus Bathyarchaeota archaeon]MDH5494362.1 hypothetical protein [Candidatus Bathyarchaeota archaeon]